MIHELKEGIDLATDMRAAYVRHLRAALRGYNAASRAKKQLRTALDTFDSTVRRVLQVGLVADMLHLRLTRFTCQKTVSHRLRLKITQCLLLRPLK